MFIGRRRELAILREFTQRRTAGLIVCSGRRRIGKSTLIEHFSQDRKFIELYGLAPQHTTKKHEQLRHFGLLLGKALSLPPFTFDHWDMAFTTLAQLTASDEVVILLDEISWMASEDSAFPAILKGVWDTQFKKNPRLTMILCGSVSAWIEANILCDKGFMGRVSLTLQLEEMPLYDCNKFWPPNSLVSSHEKFKLLCVMGGIPRYLEEIFPHQSAEQNLKRLCFSPGAILLDEFDKIFTDIFDRRALDYAKIVLALANGPLEQTELCAKLGIEPTGGFTSKLSHLIQSGFIVRDFIWRSGKKHAKLSRYRLKDNYLRFYLKYIAPRKEQIRQGLWQELFVDDLPGWETIMGLQFENLVLNNLETIVRLLHIPPSSILSAAPYFQHETQRQRACQIDLLIETKHTLYVCEIKFCREIPLHVIDEMAEKIQRMKIARHLSVRPVLIYEGNLARSIASADFFSHLIDFKTLLIDPNI